MKDKDAGMAAAPSHDGVGGVGKRVPSPAARITQMCGRCEAQPAHEVL